MDSAESAGGRLGAVLSAPRTGVVPLSPVGPWVVTTHADARRVLTEPHLFDFPGDVTRSGDLAGSTGDSRSGHTVFAPLTPDQVARGVLVLEHEWSAALDTHDRASPEPYDAMVLLRRPIARSTTAAVLGALEPAHRDRVADLVLEWIDALAPVIAARRPPRRWSRTRRVETAARHALEDELAPLAGAEDTPAQVATLLAAGIQVPIAAGAWLLAWLGQHETGDVDPTYAVWETLRLTPPTWVTARLTTEEVELTGARVPAGRVVLVSPLLLGRSDDLVPGDDPDRSTFDPGRWHDDSRRPGAWLPFGAGPHACPGRTLGTAQLVHLAQWGVDRTISLSESVSIDQSRGIQPSPCRFTASRRETS
ncbi:cytochrome P450 [Nocardioides sp. S5]|uniref:cytochrome P450 n=1 Tax=Nocardioides sp. S5 TaxID=2017486 RepID=UPI001A8D0562|nr:cytochrome P450 [Nocardioides sp. S5]